MRCDTNSQRSKTDFSKIEATGQVATTFLPCLCYIVWWRWAPIWFLLSWKNPLAETCSLSVMVEKKKKKMASVEGLWNRSLKRERSAVTACLTHQPRPLLRPRLLMQKCVRPSPLEQGFLLWNFIHSEHSPWVGHISFSFRWCQSPPSILKPSRLHSRITYPVIYFKTIHRPKGIFSLYGAIAGL